MTFGTLKQGDKIICATCKKDLARITPKDNFCSRCGNPLTPKALELRADEYTEQRTKLIMDIVAEMKEGYASDEIIRDYYNSIKEVK